MQQIGNNIKALFFQVEKQSKEQNDALFMATREHRYK